MLGQKVAPASKRLNDEVIRRFVSQVIELARTMAQSSDRIDPEWWEAAGGCMRRLCDGTAVLDVSLQWIGGGKRFRIAFRLLDRETGAPIGDLYEVDTMQPSGVK